MQLVAGITDSLPKLVAYRLIEPALRISEPVHLVCREGKFDRLMADLAVNSLDIVLADAPFDPEIRVKAFNHLLGECGVTFFGSPALARKYSRGFPESLEGAPVIFPTSNTSLRRSLDAWLDKRGVHPNIVGEFEDSALLKVFGEAEVGLFPVPSAVENDVRKQYGAKRIGRIDGVRERFYAITVERKMKHPAIVAISETARRELFTGT